jgi:two-component system phosphate regulon sensor histidine kinase PhoR
LFWRIVGVYTLLSMLALGGLLITLNQRLRSQNRQQLEFESQQLLNSIVADYVEDPDPQGLAIRWSALIEQQGHSLTVFDVDGTEVAATSELDADARATSRNLRSRAGMEESSTMWSPSSDGILFLARRVGDEGNSEVLLLQSDVGLRLAASETTIHSASRAAVVAWLCGTACLGFVASTVVNPLRMLLRAITTREGSGDRVDLLMRLSDRTDEFGLIAESLRQFDAERQAQVTDLEQTTTEVRELANRLSIVLQSMVEGVVAVDQNERILFANDVACRMMGTARSAVQGRMIYEAIRQPDLHETVREAIQSDEPKDLEFRLPRGDTQLAVVAAPIKDGKSTGAVLVFHDVSEIRRLEAMRRDFVSGVSHELKTPLTVIQACTETLLDGAIEDRETAERFLKQIEEQSERLLQLILGMLQLARVQSGEQAFKREPVAVHEIAAELVRSMQPVAESKNIELALSGEEEMYVLSDEYALRTILSNLIDNAIKYTGADGHVRVEMIAEDEANTIRVSDDGAGISAEHQKRVFERFYRVDKDRNRERGGTGLGLAIVKHLCHTTGADLSLESKVGKGTTITVRFPITDSF